MNPMFNLQQMVSAIKSNPVGFLAQRGINLPAGTNDPNAILQQMLNSGRVTQDQVNRAWQMAQKYR